MALLAVLSAGVAVVTWLGAPDIDWFNIGEWLEQTPAEDAVVALVHAAAISVGGYLAASTAVYVVASLLRMRSFLRGASLVTPPAIRHLVDGLLAIATIVGPTATSMPASASPSQAAPPSVTYTPVPAGDVRTQVPSSDEAPELDRTLTAYVVAPDDSLWSIAEATVEAHNPAATDTDVATYWRALVALNVPHLRSGDPNLIFVGEVLELPR